MLVVIGLLGITGGSSVDYHNGKSSILMQPAMIEPKPLQADIEVGAKISGVAECEKWFGFLVKKPQKQTYGAALQVPDGNLAASACTRGALYDALANIITVDCDTHQRIITKADTERVNGIILSLL